MNLQFIMLLSFSAAATAELTLGGFGLKEDADVEFQTLSNGMINDLDGNAYALSEMEPYTDMFSPDYYDIVGDKAVEKLTGDEISISVFKNTFDDVTVITTVDDSSEVATAEILAPGHITSVVRERHPDRHLAEDEAEYMTFSAEAIDLEAINEKFGYGEAPVPEDEDRARGLRGAQDLFPIHPRALANQCNHRPNRNNCRCLRTVDIGIVYDGEFCGMYGSRRGAEGRIQSIVAQANKVLEDSMCVRLELTRIYSPDGCGSRDFFRSMADSQACAGNSFLRQFTDKMNRGSRDDFRFSDTTAVHAFSGEPPSGPSIGCAWTGTVCNPNYSYGVNYMSYSNNLRLQAMLFLHEFSHNLGAKHINTPNFVMYRAITTSDRGFSGTSRNVILNMLDGARCAYNVGGGGGGGGGLTLGGATLGRPGN